MNDIEILEELRHELGVYANGEKVRQGQAIENLIQRNKDLEQIEKEHKEENGRLREELKKIEYIKRNFDYCLEQKIEKEHKEENGRLRDKIKELEKVILLDSKPIILGMIPISRIKEKIEELTKIKGDLATYIATSERIKVLQELLEESEK